MKQMMNKLFQDYSAGTNPTAGPRGCRFQSDSPLTDGSRTSRTLPLTSLVTVGYSPDIGIIKIDCQLLGMFPKCKLTEGVISAAALQGTSCIPMSKILCIVKNFFSSNSDHDVKFTNLEVSDDHDFKQTITWLYDY